MNEKRQQLARKAHKENPKTLAVDYPDATGLGIIVFDIFFI